MHKHKIIRAPIADELKPSRRLTRLIKALRQQVKGSRRRDWNLGEGPGEWIKDIAVMGGE